LASQRNLERLEVERADRLGSYERFEFRDELGLEGRAEGFFLPSGS
jgi:hypothetical protein